MTPKDLNAFVAWTFERELDQLEEPSMLGGKVPWGFRIGDTGDLVPIPEQQAALRKMRRMRAAGLALRAIAEKMRATGVAISHQGGENALVAADRQPAT
jgi:hypothetical protein